MPQALAILILVVLAMVLFNKLKNYGTRNQRKNKAGDVIDISDAWISVDNLPYRVKDTLLNTEELEIYQYLTSILPSPYLVCPKVCLADILMVPNHTGNRQAYQSRINERTVDFIICSGNNMKPLLAIFVEYDLEARKKQIHDGLTKKALEAAGVNSITIKNSTLPAPATIIKQVQKEGIQI